MKLLHGYLKGSEEGDIIKGWVGSGMGRDRREVQRARRMNENMQLLWLRRAGTSLYNIPETWLG